MPKRRNYPTGPFRERACLVGAAVRRSGGYWALEDSLAELATWHRVSDLVDACRVVTAARSGFDACGLDHLRPLLSDPQIERLARAVLETPHIDIAATDIRARMQRGLSIRHLVPDCVHAYIQRNGLYLADAAGD